MHTKKLILVSKIVLTVAIGVVILFYGTRSSNQIYCVKAPCPTNESAYIAHNIYSKLTFNEVFIGNPLAVIIKNFFQPHLSAGTVYLGISLIMSMVVWYILISIAIYLIGHLIRIFNVRSNTFH